MPLLEIETIFIRCIRATRGLRLELGTRVFFPIPAACPLLARLPLNWTTKLRKTQQNCYSNSNGNWRWRETVGWARYSSCAGLQVISFIKSFRMERRYQRTAGAPIPSFTKEPRSATTNTLQDFLCIYITNPPHHALRRIILQPL